MRRAFIPSVTGGEEIPVADNQGLSTKVLQDALFPSGSHGVPEFQTHFLTPHPEAFNTRPSTPSLVFAGRPAPASAPSVSRPVSSWREAADLRNRELSSRGKAGRPFTAHPMQVQPSLHMNMGQSPSVSDAEDPMYLPNIEGGLLSPEDSYQEHLKSRLASERGLRAISTAVSRPTYTNRALNTPSVVLRSSFPPRPPGAVQFVNDYPEVAHLVRQEEAYAQAIFSAHDSPERRSKSSSPKRQPKNVPDDDLLRLDRMNLASLERAKTAETPGGVSHRSRPDGMRVQIEIPASPGSLSSMPPPSPSKYRQKVANRERQEQEWASNLEQHKKRLLEARAMGRTVLALDPDVEVMRSKMEAERKAAAEEKAAEIQANYKEQASLVANAPVKVQASLRKDVVILWDTRKNQLASERKEQTQHTLHEAQAELAKFRDTRSRTMQQLEANRDPDSEARVKKRIDGQRARTQYFQKKREAEITEFKEKLKKTPPRISAFLTPEEKRSRQATNLKWTEKKFTALRKKQARETQQELRRRALNREFEAQRIQEEEIRKQKANPYAVPIVRR